MYPISLPEGPADGPAPFLTHAHFPSEHAHTPQRVDTKTRLAKPQPGFQRDGILSQRRLLRRPLPRGRVSLPARKAALEYSVQMYIFLPTGVFELIHFFKAKNSY